MVKALAVRFHFNLNEYAHPWDRIGSTGAFSFDGSAHPPALVREFAVGVGIPGRAVQQEMRLGTHCREYGLIDSGNV